MFLKIQFKNLLFDEVLSLSDYHPDYRIPAHGCAAGSLVGNHNSSCTASAMCRKHRRTEGVLLLRKPGRPSLLPHKAQSEVKLGVSPH